MKRLTIALLILVGVVIGGTAVAGGLIWGAPAVVAMLDGQRVAASATAVTTSLNGVASPQAAAQSAPTATANKPPAADLKPEQAVATIAPAAQQVAPALTSEEQTVISVYEKARPGVVNITVSGDTSGSGTLPGNQRSGLGSGFVVDREGHILTNAHVVADAQNLVVTFADGTKAEATVTGQDASSDLAVVKVEVAADKLFPLTLGDSSQLRPGQLAIAIGNPLGLDGSVTTGIVSGLARDLESPTGRPIRDVIQTDASINPGNSGGPLLNSAGEVIGINTAIEQSPTGGTGVGFAVPINIAKQHLPTMIAGKRVSHPWLGIRGVALADLNPSNLEELNLPSDLKNGVYVIEVTADSPADRAGVRGVGSVRDSQQSLVPSGGDVITQVNGSDVSAVQDIVRYLETKQVGDKVELTVVRDGKSIQLEVTLADWPEA